MKKFRKFSSNCCCVALYDKENRTLLYKLMPWLHCNVTNYNSKEPSTQECDIAILDMALERQVSCDSEEAAVEIIRNRMDGFYTKPADYLTQIDGMYCETVFYKDTPVGVVKYYNHGITLSMFYDSTPIIRTTTRNVSYNLCGNDGAVTGPRISYFDATGLSIPASTMCSSSFIINHGNDDYEYVTIKPYSA